MVALNNLIVLLFFQHNSTSACSVSTSVLLTGTVPLVFDACHSNVSLLLGSHIFDFDLFSRNSSFEDKQLLVGLLVIIVV